MLLNRPVKTCFRYGSSPNFHPAINLATYEQLVGSLSKRHAVSPPTTRKRRVFLRLLVSIWFQVLFHPPLGVLFTFPSRYLFTIGHRRVFSLARWFWRIPTDFHLFRGTRDCCPTSHSDFTYGTVTLCGSAFQKILLPE
jgi:hypothetical protein